MRNISASWMVESAIQSASERVASRQVNRDTTQLSAGIFSSAPGITRDMWRNCMLSRLPPTS